MKRMYLLSALVMLLLTSCGPMVNYFGNTVNPPTTNVEVFFDEKDVKKEYTVLGHMSADAEDNTDGIFYQTMEEVKNAMIEKAKECGGDALIFVDIRETSSGSYEYTEPAEGHEPGAASTETVNQTKKIIKAKLLKYK